jgi:hypothetical protein
MSIFAQQNNFPDTIAANNAGRYQSKELLKQKQKEYKLHKINTIAKGAIKIGGKKTNGAWYVMDSTLSDFGIKVQQENWEEKKLTGFEYDEIKAKDGLGDEYTLYKKKPSEWNTLLAKKGWKISKNEAGKDAVPKTVKKADATDGVLYGKLDEIIETRLLLSQGFVSKAEKENKQRYEEEIVDVQGVSVTLYKKEEKGKAEFDAWFHMIIPTCTIILALTIRLFWKKRKSKKMDNSTVKKTLFTVKHPIVTPENPSTQPQVPSTPQQPKDQPAHVHPITSQPQTSISTTPVAFATDADEWIIVGASVVGNGHISQNLPCQDNHKYEYLGEGWGIAVTSDGAGSAKNSHIGSKIVVARSIFHFKNLITKNLINQSAVPTETEWSQIAFVTLKAVYNDLVAFAHKQNLDLKSLYATAMVVVHTPDGILATHVGDGRAGYKNEKGEWKALITPHKGEEANQTIFVPSAFWDIPAYKMSGVLVPESVVVAEKPFAFTLMSDGCEHTAWLFNQKDETTGKFFDPNKPYPNFFNPLVETLQSFRKENVDVKERAEKWGNFITSGTKSFEREQDDKTMILGVVYM